MPTKGITSPEGMLMLCVAASLDIAGFIIFILGTWFGVDDYGILEMVGIAIIGTWMFIRHSSLGGTAFNKAEQEHGEGKRVWEESETVKGSDKMEDWKKNDKGVYELTKKEGKSNAPTKGKKIKEWLNPKEIAKDQIKQLAKKALKRFGLNFIVELLPFLGGFWPGWTIIVWKEMKE